VEKWDLGFSKHFMGLRRNLRQLLCESMSRKWFQSHRALIIWWVRVPDRLPVLVFEKVIECDWGKSGGKPANSNSCFSVYFPTTQMLIFLVFVQIFTIFVQIHKKNIESSLIAHNSRAYHDNIQTNLVNFSLETQELLIFHHSSYTPCHGQWLHIAWWSLCDFY
jgi:hypothetical protein